MIRPIPHEPRTDAEVDPRGLASGLVLGEGPRRLFLFFGGKKRSVPSVPPLLDQDPSTSTAG